MTRLFRCEGQPFVSPPLFALLSLLLLASFDGRPERLRVYASAHQDSSSVTVTALSATQWKNGAFVFGFGGVL
jgi:hypothetical protein